MSSARIAHGSVRGGFGSGFGDRSEIFSGAAALCEGLNAGVSGRVACTVAEGSGFGGVRAVSGTGMARCWAVAGSGFGPWLASAGGGEAGLGCEVVPMLAAAAAAGGSAGGGD